jgi:hypothetical protein
MAGQIGLDLLDYFVEELEQFGLTPPVAIY